MTEINPFIKYVMKDEKEDIVHSSTYAKAQSGGSMGVASAQSFAERQRIEQNRQVIRGYGASRVANSAISGGPRAKTYTPPVGGVKSVGGGPRPPMPKPLGLSPKR